jgi:hypothetical protein
MRRFAPHHNVWVVICPDIGVYSYISRFTTIADQTSHKKKLEGVAKQRLQVFSWFEVECKAL